MKAMSPAAKTLIGTVAGVGAVALALAAMRWGAHDYGRFVALAAISIVASRLKVGFPGVDGSMSVNLPFILIAAVALTAPEAMLIAALSTLAQCLPAGEKRPRPAQVLFNVANMINAVGLASLVLRRAAAFAPLGKSVLVVLTAAAYMLANTLPVAAIISLTGHRRLPAVWRELFQLSFPYFVLGAGVAAIVVTATQYVGWRGSLAALPVMYGVYRSYRLYFHREVAGAISQEVLVSSAAD